LVVTIIFNKLFYNIGKHNNKQSTCHKYIIIVLNNKTLSVKIENGEALNHVLGTIAAKKSQSLHNIQCL